MAADTKRAQVPEYIDYRPGDELGAFWLYLPRLKNLLAAHGLHVVTAGEKAVLDAVADLTDEQVLQVHSIDRSLCNTELARREAAK